MRFWWESHTVSNPLRALFVGPYIHSGLVRIAEELYALNVASKQQTSSTMCMYLTVWILFINLYTIFIYAQMQKYVL